MPQCVVCAKHPSVGNSVSHANNKTKRRWNPNLQKIRILWQGKTQMVNVCTSCLRSGKITKVARGMNAEAQRQRQAASAS